MSMLIAFQLIRNWDGTLHLITSTPDQSEKGRLLKFLQHLSDQARLPSTTEFYVLIGNFKESMLNAPAADLNIFGIPGDPDFRFMRKAPEEINTSCLFVKDSGSENALI